MHHLQIYSASLQDVFLFCFIISFTVQKLISLIMSHLSIFAFISNALGDWPKKTLVRFMSDTVLIMFFSKSFMVLCLIFKFLWHFEFIFVYAVKMCSSFILLWFWFAFLWWLAMLTIFSCACWPSICMSSLRKMSFHDFCPFFNTAFFFWHLVVWASYIFWILTPYQWYELQNFSPIQKVVFSFCQWFPLLCKSF